MSEGSEGAAQPNDETASNETTGDESAAVPVRRPRRYRVPLVIGRVLVGLLSASALTLSYLGWTVRSEVKANTSTTDVFTEEVQRDAPPADDGANDILLVGSDTRTDVQGNPLPATVLRELRTEASGGVNTDTIILLRIPRDGGEPVLVSIPRDTYVPIPGYRDDKINAAYGVTKSRVAHQLADSGERDRAKIDQESDRQGRAALVQAVQNLTGVRVDHYAEVNLYGFYLLTKAIGGVEVCLKQATSDPDSGANFRRGKQTVSGGAALSFVRQRENLPRGDLDRIVRQQVFLSSAMRQVLSAGTLTDQGRFTALMDVVRKAIAVDPGMDVVDLVGHLSKVSSGEVRFVTIPVTAVGARNERGQSIITVDGAQVKAFVGQLVAARPATAQPTAPPSTVPGSTVPGSTVPSSTVPSSGSSQPAPTTAQGVNGPPLLRFNGAPAAVPQPTTVDGVPCVD